MLTLDSRMKTFPTKDQMADLIECYAKMMEVNVWNETRYVSGTWDDKDRTWTVVVRRKINGINVDG
jgi:cation diffusion facilitator CzcD-associated flavoprotein CzcO